MTIKEYIERLEDIRNREFISYMDLSKELGIAYQTLARIKNNPTSCSMKTARKIKAFVDEWVSKNDPVA